MKIIASKCEIPGLNIPGNGGKREDNLQNVRYIVEDDIAPSRWAASLTARLLEERGIAAEEIGVIVGISILVTDTTESCNSAAPGVCHTVQNVIGAKNAFVFDLFHSDWSKALEIADIFISQSPQKYGLVVKVEKFNRYNNEGSTYAWPDGASAILFEKTDSVTAGADHFYIDEQKVGGASLGFIQNEDLDNSLLKFRIGWNCDAERVGEFTDALNNVVSHYSNNSDEAALIISDKWFPSQLEGDKEDAAKTGQNADPLLGMHYLPWRLQQITTAKENKEEKRVRAVTYNPFTVEFTSIAFNI